MKQLVAFAIVLLSSVASAQPGVAPPAAAPAAPACSVTIARAPDDVRATVESWVKAEPTCTVQLEVRIVPTDGGYYLLARDEFGRIRERIVPDAQSAGVLVASWMAADSHGGQTPYDIRKPSLAPAPPPMAAPMPAMPEVADARPPGMMPLVAAAPAPARERFLSIGAIAELSADSGGGVRIEWDWRRRGRWIFGFVGSASTSHSEHYGYDAYGTINTFDSKVLAYVGASTRAGGWGLRATLGAGVVHTSAEVDYDTMFTSADGVFPTAEATLSFDRDLGSSWALSMGPVISLFGQKYEVYDAGDTYWYSETLRRDFDVTMYFAARYKL